MKLIIGLGNIGAEYSGTRHNIGFHILDAYAALCEAPWQEKNKFKAQIAETTLAGQAVLLVKPTTYYNASGEAIRAIKDFYKIENTEILVIHDDLDLPFGTIRLRQDGSHAGNNGIKSLIAHLGADFTRIRVGIANEHRETADAADFVLARFSTMEQEKIPELIQLAHNLIKEFLAGEANHKSLNA